MIGKQLLFPLFPGLGREGGMWIVERCSHLSGQQLLWGMGQINVQDFQAAPHIPARGFTGAGLQGMADRDNAAFTPGDPTLG